MAENRAVEDRLADVEFTMGAIGEELLEILRIDPDSKFKEPLRNIELALLRFGQVGR